MNIFIGVRLPKEAKPYWTNQLQQFADRFNKEKIKEIQFGKQDIRGSESITLIDLKDCVPTQLRFTNKWDMLGFVQGYNEVQNTTTSRLNEFLI